MRPLVILSIFLLAVAVGLNPVESQAAAPLASHQAVGLEVLSPTLMRGLLLIVILIGMVTFFRRDPIKQPKKSVALIELS